MDKQWMKILNTILISSALIILGVSIRANKNKQRASTPAQTNSKVEVVEEKGGNELINESLQGIPEIRQRAKASWYGKEVCETSYGTPQCKTASGEIFNETKLTFASRFLEYGTRVEFCYGDSCVVCRRTDYGPAVWTNRTFDLSRACFNGLADLSKGVITVSWRKVGE